MNARPLIGLVLSLAGIVSVRTASGQSPSEGATPALPAPGRGATLFPADLPPREVARFHALGFDKPAAGVIHRLAHPAVNGMPLGGVDTGCIDFETSGLWGYSTIFNSHVPRQGPHNVPALGIGVGGRAWVLCDPAQAKTYEINMPEGPITRAPAVTKLPFDAVGKAREIRYWGHYPVADVEFDTDAPVRAALRAWTPFLPGDLRASMIPGCVFEVHLVNETGAEQRGAVAFHFPEPTVPEAGGDRAERREVHGDLEGIAVTAPNAAYVVGVVGPARARVGGGLGADGAAWARIGSALPEAAEGSRAASVAVDFDLPAGRSTIVRFVAAWHSPRWKAGGNPAARKGPLYTHMYVREYPDALQAALALARNHETLLRRVLAWQQAVYADAALPPWLQDSLINMLHLITEDGLWAQAAPPLRDWVRPEDGLFGMNESPRGCPQIECIPCSFYGNLPLVYFFPALALSTLRGAKGYQDAEGAPPWIFGSDACYTKPIRGYQVTLNGPCYVDMLDRYLMCHGDDAVLKEFYPSIKKAVEFTLDLNRGPDGVISMPDRRVSDRSFFDWETEWFEYYAWHGMVAHVGAIHLAMLRMAERMARRAGDESFAKRCGAWIEAGSASMEKLWAGSYYLNFWDPAAGKKSDHVFAYQLDGEWMARAHGLPGVFPAGRVKTTLGTIRRLCVPPTPYGAINYVHADGSVLKSGEWPMRGPYKPYDFFSPELFMLAMTYMYEGEGDFGMDLTRRCLHNIVCAQGGAWDMPNIILGDTGKRSFGNDYYQNLMLWSLPAAMEGKDLAAPTRPGGLVDRMLKAARDPAAGGGK